VTLHLPTANFSGPVQDGRQDQMQLKRTIAYTLDLIG
jgi:hypothetical protein